VPFKIDDLRHIRYISIILTLLTVGQVYGQGSSIKGFLWPPVSLGQFYYGELTIGFEKNLKNNKSIGLTLNTWIYGDWKYTQEVTTNYNSYGYANLIFDLRKYIDSENKILNNCYGGAYSILSRNVGSLKGGCKNFENGVSYSGMLFGLGLAAGKKLNLTDRLTFDIGGGIAGTYMIYSYYTLGLNCFGTDNTPNFKFLPRGIFTIGVNIGTKKKENKNGT